MKLYKFNYKGTIGNNVITVPTDSQFLIGIGNGDLSSTTQLFDGNTEILPEDEKIGEYTCFKMETQGTQFRKPYKAVITGYKTEYVNKDTNTYEHSNFIADVIIPEETYELDGTIYKQVPWRGAGQRPEKVEVRYRDTNGDVLGIVKYHFASQVVTSGTMRVTWKIDDEFASLEYACPNIWFKASAVYQWNKVGFKSFSASDFVEISKNETGTPVPIEVNIPYTQNIDLLVICQKMSVAYRDETGITPSEAVDAVKDSGEFLSKTTIGQFDYYVPDASIITADGKGINIIGGNFSMSTSEESGAATVLEAYSDNENEELMASGVINGEEGLNINNVTLGTPSINTFLNEEGNEYKPTEITVKINGVEKTVKAFVDQNI